MAKQMVTFVVDTERDRDILRWLGSQDNKSAAIREAIREHLGRGGITLTDQKPDHQSLAKTTSTRCTGRAFQLAQVLSAQGFCAIIWGLWRSQNW